MTLQAARFVIDYGSRVPYWDDWNLVPCVAGTQPLSFSWLWAQYNEHRFPLPKLLLWGSLKLAGADFRAGMWLNAVAISALSLGFIAAVRRLRGRSSVADAFFPIVLMNLGHADALVWTMVHTYVLPTALAGALLILIATGSGVFSSLRACLFGSGLVALCLSGANGLIYVPCLAAWLGWVGLAHLRGAGFRRGWGTGVAALSFAAASLALIVLYFVDFRPVTFTPSTARSATVLKDFVKGFVIFLSMNLGVAARPYWKPLGALLCTLVAACLVLIGRSIMRRGSTDRLRDLGLLAFLSSCLLLGVAVAWGRAPWGPECLFLARYTTMAVPLLCGVYIVWELKGPERLRAVVRSGLFLLALWLVPQNASLGHQVARESSTIRRALERDLRVETPVYLLVKRNPGLFPFHDMMQDFLIAMRRAGFPAYAKVLENPPFREVHLTPSHATAEGIEGTAAEGRASGQDSRLVYDLPRPRQVSGIRLRCRVDNGRGMSPHVQIQWRERNREGFSDSKKYVHFMLPPGQDGTVTCWIEESIDQLSVRPDAGPCTFVIREITLLEK